VHLEDKTISKGMTESTEIAPHGWEIPSGSNGILVMYLFASGNLASPCFVTISKISIASVPNQSCAIF